MKNCATCGQKRTVGRDGQCHECNQKEWDSRWWAKCPEHGEDLAPSGSCHECAMLMPPIMRLEPL
jgi:hypothetical protein